MSGYLLAAHAAHAAHASGYLLAAHVTRATHKSNEADFIRYGLVLLVGIIIGRLTGRRAGLRHLGDAEFQTRWRNVRSSHRF